MAGQLWGNAMKRGLFWLLGLLPGLVALLFVHSADFASAGSLLGLLGRLTGILGLAMMLVAAMMACRVPGFDRPFGGLTKLWLTHHRLGAAAFLLLLAHPLLLALAAAEVSLHAAVTTLFPITVAPALWLGWGALLLTMLFMAPSFALFGAVAYQRWKWLHRVSGVALLLALAHAIPLARTIPPPWETLIWLALTLLAVAALGYRFLFSRRWGRRPHRVEAVMQCANNVVELSLRPEGEPLRHRAGQFVYLTPHDPALASGHGEEHPYTISSAPGEAQLRIAIKDLGDASRAIQQIALGSRVDIEGPYGDFFPAATSAGPSLWIAGGIGITPFLGRLRELAASDATVDIVLIYCVQDETRALFLDELQQLTARMPGCRLVMHYFYREGPLDAEFVQRHCADPGARQGWICGPAPLLKCGRALLIAAGMPARQITTEEFSLLS